MRIFVEETKVMERCEKYRPYTALSNRLENAIKMTESAVKNQLITRGYRPVEIIRRLRGRQ